MTKSRKRILLDHCAGSLCDISNEHVFRPQSCLIDSVYVCFIQKYPHTKNVYPLLGGFMLICGEL